MKILSAKNGNMEIDTESSKQICMYINVHACVFILGRNNGRKFSIDEGPHIKRA